ncbi:hypothetical protein GCM10010193_69690 [Kitasatospora atroaurantiaca]|uniref:Uncharacterized protein n=1 Tax=Kitasatospora atroaurantiaca TaxID=285545 RepID=A0A561EN67_9ACTN|nr:hypothetical protein [Kitasatospora atroaurantiaca]TWE17054.1 hypothetical protein FB465_2058 [Kitasatospora atroaurantiaca]
MKIQEPEYLPMPTGLDDRALALEESGVASSAAEAFWMASCEAIGGVGRSEHNHRDQFWFGDLPDEQREVWDRIAEREGRRFYFHQAKDTLVGYLAHGRHDARLSVSMERELVDRLRQEREERAGQVAASTGDITDLARRDARACLQRLYSGQIPASVADEIASAALGTALHEIERLRAQLTTAGIIELPATSIPAGPGTAERLRVRWDRLVTTEPGQDTVVSCATLDGSSPVDLLLDDDLREALALSLIDPDGTMDQPAELTVWRAELDGVPLGTYTTAGPGREHCETDLRDSSLQAGLLTTLEWVHVADDAPHELWLRRPDGTEEQTGYLVVPVPVQDEYDSDGES